VPTHEEREVLERLRRIEECLFMVVALLEDLVELERPPTYWAPTGFSFKTQ
jgi:hypothetical protein